MFEVVKRHASQEQKRLSLTSGHIFQELINVICHHIIKTKIFKKYHTTRKNYSIS